MDINDLTTTKIYNDTAISKSNVSDWCRGNKLPSSKALIKLHETYNMPVGYILTGKEISVDESKLLEIYHKLDQQNKNIANHELQHLYEIQKIKSERSDKN